MEITYYGHSCFQINTGGFKLLFDPFISPNELAAHIDVSSIEADFILLSHGHADHVADAEKIARRTGAEIISSFEIATWYENKGLKKTHSMNVGGKWKFPFGLVKMVNAIHSNSLPDGTYGGTASGFVIDTGKEVFYYSGDTALFSDMKLIAEQYTLDFAFLCIGDNYTMDINEAITAAGFVQTNKIIGMHYDTFPWIKIDKEKVLHIAKEAGKELVLMKIGETIKH